ncbi:hypothetical protein B0H13DRAFT_2300162 [Mycena leptocephala]|nr:hypothetical protein B0H13DRAFT_2300162 [Mycena leptocephala]
MEVISQKAPLSISAWFVHFQGLSPQVNFIVGVLQTGCTIPGISDCYHMSLGSNPKEQLDTNHLDSPRQRDEFHFPQYLYNSTGSGSTWFHLMQVFDAVKNGPLVTLDAVSGILRIKDYVRGIGGTSCGTITYPEIELHNYLGTTTTYNFWQLWCFG